jgi:release factor glutamine methyltransferase
VTSHDAALKAGRATLHDAGIENGALDARLLLAAAAGIDMTALIARGRDALPAATEALFASYIGRRAAGEPVARILGAKEFWGLRFELGPATLVPRPETEILVEAVLDTLGRRRGEPLRILDLGTGSGCILAALLSECPRATGIGIDADPAAVEIAGANFRRLGLADRATAEVGDWLENVAAPADVIVSNPPYIREAEIAGLSPEVRDFDPHAALSGGADGLAAYRRILVRVGPVLASRGLLAFEVGAGQAAAVAGLMRAAGIVDGGIRSDLAGVERVVLGSAAG